jgi:hypothetical protein
MKSGKKRCSTKRKLESLSEKFNFGVYRSIITTTKQEAHIVHDHIKKHSLLHSRLVYDTKQISLSYTTFISCIFRYSERLTKYKLQEYT